MKNNSLSRRRFLAQCAMFSATGAASSLASLGALSLPAAAVAARARPSQYRAMVCIYLTGGNDLNMMVPLDDYNNYKSVRGNLALKQSDLLPITSGSGPNSRSYGLHPSFSGAHELYQSNKLAFIANTGAINVPTTAADFTNKTVPLPPKLFAHNTQKDFVRAGLPFDGRRITGWAGRIADLYMGATPLNLSLAGDNIWQRGSSTTAYGLSGASIPKLQGYSSVNSGPGGDERGAALRAMNELDTDHLLTREYGRIVQSSLDLSSGLRNGIAQPKIQLQTKFPNTKFASSLRNIANVINAREGMQMPQQVFYVNSGGWDHHRDLLFRHSSSLNELGDALVAFDSALAEMGLQDQVVTFTNHDFGRTLTSNGSGSDHAWGGHQLVMGGKGLNTSNVLGGEVYGIHPEFSTSDPQFLNFRNRGVIVPSTSTDQLSATIAKWFGDFSDNELVDLFPSLANFNDKTLGFMS